MGTHILDTERSQFWSRGFVLESALGVQAYAARVLGVKRLVAIAAPTNERSIHLLEKMGFQAETTVRLADDGEELGLYGTQLSA